MSGKLCPALDATQDINHEKILDIGLIVIACDMLNATCTALYQDDEGYDLSARLKEGLKRISEIYARDIAAAKVATRRAFIRVGREFHTFLVSLTKNQYLTMALKNHINITEKLITDQLSAEKNADKHPI